jgi:hypothetical protein
MTAVFQEQLGEPQAEAEEAQVRLVEHSPEQAMHQQRQEVSEALEQITLCELVQP